MHFDRYIVSEITPETSETTIFRLVPKNNSIPPFIPGQYVYIRNEKSATPSEAHPFSIASTPNASYLEFCIKNIGDWTSEITKINIGAELEISQASGKFVWEDHIKEAVFILGGTGIAPIMSILRSLIETNQNPTITLLYGNRNRESIAYKKELDIMKNHLNVTIINILSHIEGQETWNGYRGFITKEIMQKEIMFPHNPYFFLIGPPVFIEFIQKEIKDFKIPNERIILEKFNKE